MTNDEAIQKIINEAEEYAKLSCNEGFKDAMTPTMYAITDKGDTDGKISMSLDSHAAVLNYLKRNFPTENDEGKRN